jgi:hypothetical protein
MRGLEDLGRVRLSASFFLRDFLFSEIAGFYGVPNIPEQPDLAIAAGERLCEELLEPLQATFGRIGVRSGYRSAKVTAFGNARRHGARVEVNAAYHIWDLRDGDGPHSKENNMGIIWTIIEVVPSRKTVWRPG